MASSALEEKISKIRQQNEEIRRRHQEVEEDKKNAAKLNALVQMVPSTDWPQRKEPPTFTNCLKAKQKTTKEKHEHVLQYHFTEGKKSCSFAQGEGPPPDPKYNFLADSEREEPVIECGKENGGNKSNHKALKGTFRRKPIGREKNEKDSKSTKGNYRGESQSGYDAWRAERNRIDEDRISRQRTAEGNWRREWDNDKVHIADNVTKESLKSTLGDFARKDQKDSDKRYCANYNEHANHNHGGNHNFHHRGPSRNFYSNYDNRSHNSHDQQRSNPMVVKPPISFNSEKRTVIATDKSLKVTLNQCSAMKNQVMSVKVKSPNIAGTGRVGPRQKTRVTYSHSDVDFPLSDNGEHFPRQKSFEDKSRETCFGNQRHAYLKRFHMYKEKENESKPKNVDFANSHKHSGNDIRSDTRKSQKLRVIESQGDNVSDNVSDNVKETKHSSSVNTSEKVEDLESPTSNGVKVELIDKDEDVNYNVTIEMHNFPNVTNETSMMKELGESSMITLLNTDENDENDGNESDFSVSDNLQGDRDSSIIHDTNVALKEEDFLHIEETRQDERNSVKEDEKLSDCDKDMQKKYVISKKKQSMGDHADQAIAIAKGCRKDGENIEEL